VSNGTLSLSLVLFAVAAPLSAQERWRPWTYAVDSVPSLLLGETRRIRVAVPAGYSSEDSQLRRYPVAVVLDAENETAFAALLTNLRLLEHPLGPAVPPMIVVGVVAGRTRERDMIPKGSAGMDRARPSAGGAHLFSQFLEKELLPWVRERYRALPYTVLAGHSYGGHFAVYAFAHAPHAFQAAVAISPAFFWISPTVTDDSLARNYAQAIAKRSNSARLFIAAGAFEPENIRRGSASLEQDIRRAGEGATVNFTWLADDNHQTARQRGLIEGFRWVFEPVSLSRNLVYGRLGPDRVDTAGILIAYRDLKAQYAIGARRLGFPEALPPDFLSALASLGGGGPTHPGKPFPIGGVVCEDYLAWYPRMPGAYECRGTLLLLNGDSSQARVQYAKALAVARENKMRETAARFEERLAALDSVLESRPRR
jgi:predicted alpha/beta superfamily hydrolase